MAGQDLLAGRVVLATLPLVPAVRRPGRDGHPGPRRAAVAAARRRCPATSSTWCAGCRPWSRTAARRPQAGPDPRDHPPLPPGDRRDPASSPSPPRRCWSWSPPCRWRWSRSSSACGWPAARWTWRTALVVLLLAPEAYWPLRRVGAEFHAAAEGTATFEAADALLTEPAATAAASPRPGCRAPAGLTLRPVSPSRYPGRADAGAGAASTRPSPPRGLVAVTGPSGAGQEHAAGGAARPRARSRASCSSTASRSTRPPRRGGPGSPGSRSGPGSRPARSATTSGSAGRTATDADVWLALEQVDLAEHVATLPDGLDSRGRRGRRSASPPVSGPGWCWPAPSSPTGPGCCSTSRPPTSTPRTETVIARTLVRLAETRAGRRGGAPRGAGDARRPRRPVDRLPTPSRSAPHAAVTARDLTARPPSRRPVRSGGRNRGVSPRSDGSASVVAGPGDRRSLLGALATAAGVALTATAGLADRPRLRAAAGAAADGRDRRGPHVRPGPAGAAVRRAAGLARRRARRARRGAGPGVRRAGAAGARPARRRSGAAATCSPASSTTSTPWSTGGSGCAAPLWTAAPGAAGRRPARRAGAARRRDGARADRRRAVRAARSAWPGSPPVAPSRTSWPPVAPCPTGSPPPSRASPT